MSLHQAYTLCFEAWEGKDRGKEDSKDDAMKPELQQDGLFLVMGKVLYIFFLPVLQTLHSQRLLFKDLAELVLLTFSVQEPKVDGQEQKICLHLSSKIYIKFLLCLHSARQRNTFKNRLPNNNTDTQMPTTFLKSCVAGNQNQSSLDKDEPNTLNTQKTRHLGIPAVPCYT